MEWKKEKDISEETSSWKTSHLPELSSDEVQVMLDVMHGWYHDVEPNLPNTCNWEVLWEYLDRHGLGGITGSLCLDGLLQLPSEIEEQATHRYLGNQLLFEQASDCLQTIQKAAFDNDIPVMVLKGPAVIHQGYEDPGTRYFSDIDMFTDSKESFFRLCEMTGASILNNTDDHNWFGRAGESDGASFGLDGFEVEFRWPQSPASDPMFDLLATHKSILQQVPQELDSLISPNPSLHLVFLIQHMAVHHLFSRFFWFLDLAVLFRKCRAEMDMDWIEDELARTGQLNAASVVSQFCRKHIDPKFPLFKAILPAWNYEKMSIIAEPSHIANGTFGIYHQHAWDKFLSYFYSMMSFYLVEDPKNKLFSIGYGNFWIMLRLKRMVGIRSYHLVPGIIMSLLIGAFTFPVSRLVALFIKPTK